MPPDTCGSCRFFERLAIGQAMGNCRSKPPIPVMVGVNAQGNPVANTYWPRLPDTEWCGDFTRRAVEAIELAGLPVAEMEHAG